MPHGHSFRSWPCMLWRWQTAVVAWLPALAPVVGAPQIHVVLHFHRRLAQGQDPNWTLWWVRRGMPCTHPPKKCLVAHPCQGGCFGTQTASSALLGEEKGTHPAGHSPK